MLQTYQKTISLDQIQLYSQCPRKFGFSLNSPASPSKPSQFKQDIKTLVKQSYINRTQHGYSPQWETIKQRVNKLCFSDVDINNKEAFKLASKRSIDLLKALHYWYYKHFTSDTREALANIPLQVSVNRTIITETLDLAFLDKKYKIIPGIFNDNDILPNMLYNNIRFKALLWMIYQSVSTVPYVTDYIIIGERSLNIHPVFNKSHMDTIDKYVNFIIRGIENKIFYPSVNAQCEECNWKDQCII